MTEGWITRQNCSAPVSSYWLDSSLGVARVWEHCLGLSSRLCWGLQLRLMQQACVQTDQQICTHHYLPPSLNLGIACHAEICPAHSYFASSRILPSYANHRLPTWWYLRLGICVITYHSFGKVSVSRQLPELLSATLTKNNFSDVAKFCLPSLKTRW